MLLLILLACPRLASAQIRFLQPSADLGELRGGPAYEHRFDFVNESKDALEITDIRLGCGCLQPMLDKRVFAGGEKGTLRLKIRTLGQPDGMRTWQAHVQTRQGPQTRETTLIVAATIRNEITVEPSIVAMTVETALKQEIVIRDRRTPPCKVIAVRASSPAIRIAMQPPADGVMRVALEVSAADLGPERREETLSIFTDDAYYRELEVPITLVKASRPLVTATPAQAEIVGSGSQLVRLRAGGDRAVRIEKAQANNPGIKCIWAAGPGNDATLKISADATATLQAPSTPPRVTVHFAEPMGATITIPIVLRRD